MCVCTIFKIVSAPWIFRLIASMCFACGLGSLVFSCMDLSRGSAEDPFGTFVTPWLHTRSVVGNLLGCWIEQAWETSQGGRGQDWDGDLFAAPGSALRQAREGNTWRAPREHRCVSCFCGWVLYKQLGIARCFGRFWPLLPPFRQMTPRWLCLSY